MSADGVEPPAAGLLEVGRVARSHGLHGEVIVEMTSNRSERTSAGAGLQTGSGELVVAEARPHGNRWLVRFVGVSSREDADALRGTRLWAEPIALDDDDDTLWIHELIGCAVVDQQGQSRGTVASVLDNPAGDILELDSGALVPVRFVVSPPLDGRLVVDAPEGLFDI